MPPLRGSGSRQIRETPGLRPGLDDVGATRLSRKTSSSLRLQHAGEQEAHDDHAENDPVHDE